MPLRDLPRRSASRPSLKTMRRLAGQLHCRRRVPRGAVSRDRPCARAVRRKRIFPGRQECGRSLMRNFWEIGDVRRTGREGGIRDAHAAIEWGTQVALAAAVERPPSAESAEAGGPLASREVWAYAAGRVAMTAAAVSFSSSSSGMPELRDTSADLELAPDRLSDLRGQFLKLVAAERMK